MVAPLESPFESCGGLYVLRTEPPYTGANYSVLNDQNETRVKVRILRLHLTAATTSCYSPIGPRSRQGIGEYRTKSAS